ncbi:antibiotic biosynthesis monooxygenase family protein [Marinospirillum alkaliphilum]|uniref:Antibiotic biosynthesis monooxygenase n=1 Tax=Marinospirillum alkaliphilum DSM 21637 TaxID=1122209 RepID=A0A1K1UH00_9GAMM|nr:antibiotic biosynthesis monooxygenase [Marinospirillum alkaliphilum]SFX11707.1 Antibiotic biosynthesis monooxygenase [Marinospirillum alkaliphilum DSM 21637]
MIKVLIERQLLEGLDEEYGHAAKALLRGCMEMPGYISGESLKDIQRPTHRVIITLWKNEQSWKDWEKSAKRQQLLAGICGLLAADEKVTLLAPL